MKFNDFVGDEIDGHFHVFKSVEGCVKVHVFDVATCKFCPICADDAVPQDFGVDHIHSSCTQFEWVVNEVATNGDADAVGVFFLCLELEAEDLSEGHN